MKEPLSELLSRLQAVFGNIDIEVVLPVAVAVVVFLAIYFLSRKKESAVETKQDQPEPATPTELTREKRVEESSIPDSKPEEVSSSELEPTENKEIVPPPPVAEPAVRAPEISEEDPAAKQAEEPEPVSEKLEPEELTSVPKREEDVEEDFFSRLTLGLSKTRKGILRNLDHIFSSDRIEDDTWDEFEEVLIMSDMGVQTTAKLRERVSSAVSADQGGDGGEIKNLLEKEILNILKKVESPPTALSEKPTVFMVAGVNGVGKTTSIGKIANRFTREGKKVMVAAADTFRAAAVEQLGVWAERVGSDFLRGQTGADPSAVAYDAVNASISRGIDLLIIDTAGRVHTKAGLMEELKKLKRVVSRELEGAPHEVLLVLDATTGQNAVEQSKVFSDAIGVTGIVLTKLDGTAKGGVIVAIAERLGLPVKYVGVGEGLEDLREFDAAQFVKALFASEKETLH